MLLEAYSLIVMHVARKVFMHIKENTILLVTPDLEVVEVAIVACSIERDTLDDHVIHDVRFFDVTNEILTQHAIISLVNFDEVLRQTGSSLKFESFSVNFWQVFYDASRKPSLGHLLDLSNVSFFNCFQKVKEELSEELLYKIVSDTAFIEKVID